MRVRLLPCSLQRSAPDSTEPPAQPLTTFMVHGDRGAGPLAIDAGSLGLVGDTDHMAAVREVLLTHAHIDHVATLPMWLEAVVGEGRVPARVHAPGPTVEALRTHLFNDVLFPDFEAIEDDRGRRLLELVEIPVDRPFALAGFTVRAFPTVHPVPTYGYLVDDGKTSVAFGADSARNPALWETVLTSSNVRAVVLETSFPDPLTELAEGSGHLTPATLREELDAAPEDVAVYVTHLKPSYRGPIARALEALEDERLRVLPPGAEFTA